MINKENDDSVSTEKTNKDTGHIDIARMDVQCHLVIKDKDTDETLVNKRG